MSGKKKIAMVVYNSVGYDARVLKEAESLARAGYAIRIFGLKDNYYSQPFETLDNGVEICRVNSRVMYYRWASGLTLLGTAMALLAVAAVFWLLIYHYQLAWSLAEAKATVYGLRFTA